MSQIIIEINDDQSDRFLDSLSTLKGYDPNSGVPKSEFIGAQLAYQLSSEVLQYEINKAVDEVTKKQDKSTINISIKTSGFSDSPIIDAESTEPDETAQQL